ncbi:quinone oxidoreductase PIG3-like isoform X1 [Dreissena polymorpha]|nr:quinone oxidoreductase PIG3-like isoform X1 [Dreissena polymorpha]
MGLKLINIVLPVSCVLLRQLHAMASDQMKYIHFEKGCEPDGLSVQTTPVPALRSREVLVKVFATAINRADILQRRGMYPAPPGESDILGLEASGTVAARADDCTSQWHIGDRVMALLAGGGYAEYVAVPEDVLMPVPSGMSLTTAAGIPEVWLTAYQLLHLVGDLQKGDTVLIHAGGSGVGTAATQLCVYAGCRPIVTAGSQSKLDTALSLGAVAAFNYKQEDFSEKVLEFTNGRGVDLILDCIGASYYEQNMKSIKTEGRWVLYGLLGGGSISGDVLSQILRKRVRITGTTLRVRPLEYKKTLTQRFTQDALPLFKADSSLQLTPIIDSVFPFHKAADAHKSMETNQNTGKIVLQIRHEDTGKTLHDEL